MRQSRIGAALAAALVLTGIAGCKTAGTGGSAGKPVVAVDVAPNASTYTIQKIAILGYANTSGKSEATQAARYVDAALAQAGMYNVTRSGGFSQDAERTGAGDKYKKCLTAWEKTRKLDAGDLGPLCEATGFDAVVAWEVSQWKEEKLDVTQEGTSNTTVEMRIEMVAPDGTLLWSGRGMKVARSQSYNPELAVSSTQSGQAIYSESMVPDPPQILPVAQEVVDEIVKTLPDLSGKPGATSPAAMGTNGGTR